MDTSVVAQTVTVSDQVTAPMNNFNASIMLTKSKEMEIRQRQLTLTHISKEKSRLIRAYRILEERERQLCEHEQNQNQNLDAVTMFVLFNRYDCQYLYLHFLLSNQHEAIHLIDIDP